MSTFRSLKSNTAQLLTTLASKSKKKKNNWLRYDYITMTEGLPFHQFQFSVFHTYPNNKDFWWDMIDDDAYVPF